MLLGPGDVYEGYVITYKSSNACELSGKVYFMSVFEILLLCLLSLIFSSFFFVFFYFYFLFFPLSSQESLGPFSLWYISLIGSGKGPRTLGREKPSQGSLLLSQRAQPPGEVGCSLLWRGDMCLLRLI